MCTDSPCSPTPWAYVPRRHGDWPAPRKQPSSSSVQPKPRDLASHSGALPTGHHDRHRIPRGGGTGRQHRRRNAHQNTDSSRTCYPAGNQVPVQDRSGVNGVPVERPVRTGNPSRLRTIPLAVRRARALWQAQHAFPSFDQALHGFRGPVRRPLLRLGRLTLTAKRTPASTGGHDTTRPTTATHSESNDSWPG